MDSSETLLASGAGDDAMPAMLHEMSAAIAQSQAALLAGKLRELAASTQQMQIVLASWNAGFQSSNAKSPERELWVASARRVRHQNLVFGGVLKRMRQGLGALQRESRGLEASYACAHRDGDSTRGLKPAPAGDAHV